ncbi:MAG: hypothetical protein N3D72_01770, partial [Candidatus Methanomethyliaceae archaeon]|nr:hypothetical protein [Candidatus Methanomethyliaceae archaeon]
LIASIVLCIINPYGYLGFIVTAFLALCGFLAHRRTGLQTVEDKRIFRKGIFGENIIIINNKFFQSYTVSQNPLQKRNNLVNVRYSYQSNTFGKTVGIRGISLDTANSKALALEKF